jgi:hypothetical protein
VAVRRYHAPFPRLGPRPSRTHFGLVEGTAATHDELMNAFGAEAGPLDDQKAVAALTSRA